jgi:hypothetical protein
MAMRMKDAPIAQPVLDQAKLADLETVLLLSASCDESAAAFATWLDERQTFPSSRVH